MCHFGELPDPRGRSNPGAPAEVSSRVSVTTAGVEEALWLLTRVIEQGARLPPFYQGAPEGLNLAAEGPREGRQRAEGEGCGRGRSCRSRRGESCREAEEHDRLDNDVKKT